jgi:hypothetical protein
MKQIIYAIFAFAAIVMVGGCSSDKSDPVDELTGTTWLSLYDSGSLYSAREIKFQTGGKCHVEVVEKTNGVVDYQTKGDGTYTYRKPTVEITWSDGFMEAGNISGNTLTLIDQTGYSDEFKKQ